MPRFELIDRIVRRIGTHEVYHIVRETDARVNIVFTILAFRLFKQLIITIKMYYGRGEFFSIFSR